MNKVSLFINQQHKTELMDVTISYSFKRVTNENPWIPDPKELSWLYLVTNPNCQLLNFENNREVTYATDLYFFGQFFKLIPSEHKPNILSCFSIRFYFENHKIDAINELKAISEFSQLKKFTMKEIHNSRY